MRSIASSMKLELDVLPSELAMRFMSPVNRTAVESLTQRLILLPAKFGQTHTSGILSSQLPLIVDVQRMTRIAFVRFQSTSSTMDSMSSCPTLFMALCKFKCSSEMVIRPNVTQQMLRCPEWRTVMGYCLLCKPQNVRPLSSSRSVQSE